MRDIHRTAGWWRLAVLVFLAVGFLTDQAAARVLPYRWVYVSRSLDSDRHVADIRNIVRTASRHGLNGMVLAAGLDKLDLQPPDYFRRLRQVKQICDQQGVEIIPIVFSVGYASSILAHNPNLAEGLPVKDAPFVVRGAEAHLVPDRRARITNGGMEAHIGHRARGYQLQDRPGAISFADTQVRRSGRASLRFEHFEEDAYRRGRVMQEVRVQPFRSYRVRCWVKTDSLRLSGWFMFQVLVGDEEYLLKWDPQLSRTSDWQEVQFGFNSMNHDRVMLYMGVWGGAGGRFWLDDLSIEEVALVNVLRRAGTPITVRGERNRRVYQQGIDYEPIRDPELNHRFDHDGPSIRLNPNSRIQEGERLRVSYFHSISNQRNQVAACMSEQGVYQIWRNQARLLHETLAPEKYFLSMDEIRSGGTCQACRDRGISMAEILGECITRQCEILRSENPRAEIMVWSDMLDPNHNAHAGYYLVAGDFTDSWKYVPRDIIIACWWDKILVPSLRHFSRLGFKTLGAAYYDGDTLDNPRRWLDALNRTRGAAGIMYTTWQNKYGLLAGFGGLITAE